MNETVGVILLGLGFVLTVPVFVVAALRSFRRKAPRATLTIYRNHHPREREIAAGPPRVH